MWHDVINNSLNGNRRTISERAQLEFLLVSWKFRPRLKSKVYIEISILSAVWFHFNKFWQLAKKKRSAKNNFGSKQKDTRKKKLKVEKESNTNQW